MLRMASTFLESADTPSLENMLKRTLDCPWSRNISLGLESNPFLLGVGRSSVDEDVVT